MKPQLLSHELIFYCQEWLRQQNGIWRILIPLDESGDDVAVVYHNAVRCGDGDDNHFEDYLKRGVEKLKLIA